MLNRRLPAVFLAALTLASLAPAVSAAGRPTVTLDGTLELEVSDHADANGRFVGPDTEDWFIRDAHGRRTKLTFPGDAPASANPGAKVRITGHRTETGLEVDGAPAVEADTGSTGTTTATATASVPTAVAPIAKRVAVLLVNFASNPVQPYTAAYANGVIFTNTSSIAAFYTEESYGTLTLTGDVYGWYTIKYDTSTCDTAAMQTAADAAATAAGVDLTAYTNVSYVFPHINACSFAGHAQLPGTRTWINTISTTTPKIHDWVVAHELGHNFGVNHASSYSCTTNGTRVALSATAADCTASEYGDPFTVMGAWNPIAKYPTTDAWHRVQMGFMAAADRRVVTGSGLYLVGATNFASSVPKSLRINRTGSTATRHWFEVEYRQPGVLFDGFATTDKVVNGLSIRLVGDDSRRTQSWLIDTTPSTASYTDAPLLVGRTFKDPLSKIAITMKSVVTDDAGNPAVMVKVLYPNTVAPAAPGNFVATSSIDGETASLSWDPAVSSIGVASYRVYRDGVRIATLPGTETTFTDPGRTAGAGYVYSVRAVDWVDLLGAVATANLVMFVPTLGTTTATFGDGTPQVQSAGGTGADTLPEIFTRATTISLGLHFSAPVMPPTAAAITLSGTATGCRVSGITGSGADYSLSVAGCSEGTLVASIATGIIHDSLGYLAPAADATSATIVIDRTAPTPKKPAAQLRVDARLAGSSVPVRISLAASDVSLAPDGSNASSGILSYDVGRSVDGAAYTTVASATTAAFLNTALSPGHSYRFRVRARDAAGNVSAWVEGLVYKPALTQESSTAITWRGAWYTGSNASYSGGAARYTLTSTPAASYTFSGRGIALVTTKGPARGRLKVYIDGVYLGTIDLYRSSAAYRVVAFSKMYSSVGTHTIKVVSLGTSGRPRVDIDAFAVIR